MSPIRCDIINDSRMIIFYKGSEIQTTTEVWLDFDSHPKIFQVSGYSINSTFRSDATGQYEQCALKVGSWTNDSPLLQHLSFACTITHYIGLGCILYTAAARWRLLVHGLRFAAGGASCLKYEWKKTSAIRIVTNRLLNRVSFIVHVETIKGFVTKKAEGCGGYHWNLFLYYILFSYMTLTGR